MCEPKSDFPHDRRCYRSGWKSGINGYRFIHLGNVGSHPGVVTRQRCDRSNSTDDHRQVAMQRTNARRGNAAVEFVMTGIPLIFIIISIVEISRGMWIYDTLAHATESTTRDMAVRGFDCAQYVTGCAMNIGSYSKLFATWATGLDPAQVTVVFQSTNQTVTCNPLNSCYSNATAWPPSGDNSRNLDIWVTGTMPFNSAIGMFIFGSSPVYFSKYTLSAKSHQQILF